MKKLIIAGMLFACLGCASKQQAPVVAPVPPAPTLVTFEDPLVPVTAGLIDLLQANGYGVTQLQFFISGPFILERSSNASQTVQLSGDKIILNESESSRQVILSDKTAGTGSLYSSVDGRVAVKVTIDNNPRQALYFAKQSDDPDALLYLRCSPELFVDFGDEIYSAKFSGGKPPFLLVKLDNKYTSPSDQYYPKDDRLPHLMAARYKASAGEKVFFMELKPGGSGTNKARLFAGDKGTAVVYDGAGKRLAEGVFEIRNNAGQQANADAASSIIITPSQDMKAIEVNRGEPLFSGYTFVFRKGDPESFSGGGLTWKIVRSVL